MCTDGPVREETPISTPEARNPSPAEIYWGYKKVTPETMQELTTIHNSYLNAKMSVEHTEGLLSGVFDDDTARHLQPLMNDGLHFDFGRINLSYDILDALQRPEEQARRVDEILQKHRDIPVVQKLIKKVAVINEEMKKTDESYDYWTALFSQKKISSELWEAGHKVEAGKTLYQATHERLGHRKYLQYAEEELLAEPLPDEHPLQVLAHLQGKVPAWITPGSTEIEDLVAQILKAKKIEIPEDLPPEKRKDFFQNQLIELIKNSDGMPRTARIVLRNILTASVWGGLDRAPLQEVTDSWDLPAYEFIDKCIAAKDRKRIKKG